MKRPFEALSAASLTILVAFLLLPLVAIFVRVPPGELLSALGDGRTVDALVVSLQTSLIAHAILLLIGTPAAYLLATREFRGKTLLITAIELPLVLPPAVAGIGLLAAFGRAGLLGDAIGVFGFSIPFTKAAVILAVVYVASPFYVRQAIAAFSDIDERMFEAARTLGSRGHNTFIKIAIPLARRGLASGSAIAWARGLGEFGATIMFAGSIQGVTQTLPLAIYAELDSDLEVALAVGSLLVIFSAAVLLIARSGSTWSRLLPTSR